MKNPFSIAFATGSRADYGIVRNYLRLLDSDERISLSILVTGSLLSEKYAHQVELIYQDGFKIDAEINIDLDSSSNAAVTHSMAVALDGFGRFFATKRYDLLIILGDRFEMLSVATAAAIQRIPILHLHGGEATFGNYDEFIRHCITKMATYHFAATEEYRRRVIQLGEHPSRVFYLGALGAENCMNIQESEVPEKVKDLAKGKYFVVLFHPETLTGASTLSQINELLAAIEAVQGFQFVFLGSNADTHSDIIRDRVYSFVQEHDNALYYENLPTCGYHYLLKNSLGLVGNSSSGLIEAPSLGIYTVNIGERQAGRVRGNSVLDVACKKDEIYTAIESLIQRNGKGKIYNPYYRENAASNYYNQTLAILNGLARDNYHPKVFFDIHWKDGEDSMLSFRNATNVR